MLYKYDKAMLDKMRELFPNTIYAPVDEFFSRYYLHHESTDSIELPALSLWRIDQEIDLGSATTQARVANLRRPHEDDDLVRQIYSIKTNLIYQLDIWAPSDIVRDDLLTELLYVLTIYPNITVEYQGDTYLFSFDIIEVEDLTDITQFEGYGDLYRCSLTLEVVGARLFYFEDVRKLKYVVWNTEVDDS